MMELNDTNWYISIKFSFKRKKGNKNDSVYAWNIGRVLFYHAQDLGFKYLNSNNFYKKKNDLRVTNF